MSTFSPELITRRVVHIGNDPAGPGGIASVIRAHLARTSEDFELTEEAWISYRVGAGKRRQLGLFGSVVIKLLRRRRPHTVVHVHLSRGGSLVREGAIILLARLLSVERVVVTVHGSSAATANAAWRLVYRLALHPAHVVHILSEAHRVLMSRDDRRVVVLPNDVARPTSVAAMSERERLVVFLGEVSRRKGVDLLLDAWRSAALEDWRLEVFGESVAESEALLEDLPPGARYGGFLGPGDVPTVLGRATLMVLPSRAEAFPMSLCEAMASGCVVLGSETGGIPEILDGDLSDQLIPLENAQELASSLVRLLRDPPALERLSQANRARSLWFSAEKVTAAWFAVYWPSQVQGEAPLAG